MTQNVSPEERVSALEPMMGDPDPRVRKSCVVALGKMSGAGAIDMLCRALNDPDEGVRVLACQAVGRKSGEDCSRALPALLAHVHDGSHEVRAGVLWAVANAVAHGGLPEDVRAALFTPVTVMAFDPDDGVRADAAAVLGTLRDERATDALSVLLEDAVARVRANACASLALTDDEKGLELLLDVLENGRETEDVLVLVSALDAVARRAERGSVVRETPAAHRAVSSALSLATSDSAVPEAVSTAVWALGRVGGLCENLAGEVKLALSRAVQSQDEWCARYAAESQALLGDDAR